MVRCTCGHERTTYKSRWNKYSGKGCQKCWIRKLGRSRRTVASSNKLEWNSWRAMRARCSNPSYVRYDRYGGRGIKVCERWNEFGNFLEDMGRKPAANYSIDRIDSDGDYTPENCRWANQSTQVRNSERSKKITYKGATKPLADFAEQFGIPHEVVYKRIWRGWTPSRAIETPYHKTP